MQEAKDTYQTIAAKSEGLYKEKGSRFISLAYPVSDEEEVREILVSLRKEYHDARHHCYAYILGAKGERLRVNDDGEPSGTAGRPIHGQLLSYGVTNMLIVVIRYFGGTKLGVSGLINAYKTAAADAIEHAKIITKTVDDIYKVTFDFLVMNDIMRLVKEESLDILEQQFNNSCSVILGVRQSKTEKVISKINKIESANVSYIKTV